MQFYVGATTRMREQATANTSDALHRMRGVKSEVKTRVEIEQTATVRDSRPTKDA